MPRSTRPARPGRPGRPGLAAGQPGHPANPANPANPASLIPQLDIMCCTGLMLDFQEIFAWGLGSQEQADVWPTLTLRMRQGKMLLTECPADVRVRILQPRFCLSIRTSRTLRIIPVVPRQYSAITLHVNTHPHTSTHIHTHPHTSTHIHTYPHISSTGKWGNGGGEERVELLVFVDDFHCRPCFGSPPRHILEHEHITIAQRRFELSKFRI